MRSTISLGGVWDLVGCDEGAQSLASWGSAVPSEAIELEGHVPGEVYVDLHHSGLIPDPYHGLNADEVQWVGRKQWWYRKTFDVDEDFVQNSIMLEFDGLDTNATVFFNGERIGKTDNMFVPHCFDVSEFVHAGRNTVAVRFDPVDKAARDSVRKMRCSFGSDHTPALLGAGIWRDARVVSVSEVSIADVRIDAEMEGGCANAWVSIEVDNNTQEDQQVMASVVIALGEDRETIEVTETIAPTGGLLEAVIRIEQPQLWWPNGFGEQSLYTCMVGLDACGEIHDVAERKFGVRSILLSETAGGASAILLVNGEEVFCKGGNWMVADLLPSNVTDRRRHSLLELARDANFNVLRVGGGGIYESDAFYDTCDEMGIMVLQDLMFSEEDCPVDDEFCREAEEEVRSVVKRLHNHPSIVLWCGNRASESQGGKLFREVIPNLLRYLDPSRPYAASCPWEGGSGAAGPPVVESIREFIAEDSLFPPTTDVWTYHGRAEGTASASGERPLADQPQDTMGEYETLEQFAVYAGILQGELIKSWVERCRREKWAVSGALLRMYNDSWPAVSSSVVDYFCRPKIAYYYAKRAFAPVIVSFGQENERLHLHVTSDERLTGVDGMAQVGVLTFGTCGFDAEELPVRLAANDSKSIWESVRIDELLTEPTRQCVVALLNVGGKVVARSVYFPRRFGEMDFPQPKLLVQREQIHETGFAINISSDDFARSVAVDNVPPEARVSDNYLDVLPGEFRRITVENVTLEQAKAVIVNVWRR